MEERNMAMKMAFFNWVYDMMLNNTQSNLEDIYDKIYF